MKSTTRFLFFLSALTSTLTFSIFASPPEDWDCVEKKIREEAISKKEALTIFRRLKPELKKYFFEKDGEKLPSGTYFPVMGYDYRATSKYDYIPNDKFDFFDKNSHSGHPAYDIFIQDENFDEKDDNTGNWVEILSVTRGLVVSTYTGWQPDSEFRGGNCIWIYDPDREGLFYYAHLRDVRVNVGDIVSAGQPIGFLGRSGKNAYVLNSHTHLHLMYVYYSDTGNIIPKPIYNLLKKAKNLVF